MKQKIMVVGGGLAGCEAAWQLGSRGIAVELWEMRPEVQTEAHQGGGLAELVCSNSLKSLDTNSAPGLLKGEMSSLDSLIIRAAYESKVPAGQALAVDRTKFSAFIEDSLNRMPNFRRVSGTITNLPDARALEKDNAWMILATGPLTHKELATEIRAKLCNGETQLYFYDAIAPVVASESLDMNHCFMANRYGKDGCDYLNIPLSQTEYESFIQDLHEAEYLPLHDFEEPKYFESCLPIEVMAQRGSETLRFGPMKPVGLVNPSTGKAPYAAIQLRKENVAGTMFSLVGFQTKMKWPEQKRIFQKIPALAGAEFLRFGTVHRNTYIDGPRVLASDLSFRANRRIFAAGQITGVEGYTESAAMGLVAGLGVLSQVLGIDHRPFPITSMIGALQAYVTQGPLGPYQPMNCNFGLLPPLEKVPREGKADRRNRQCSVAREHFSQYCDSNTNWLRWKSSAQSFSDLEMPLQ